MRSALAGVNHKLDFVIIFGEIYVSLFKMKNALAPSHINWSFGSNALDSPANAKSSQFHFSFSPTLKTRQYIFKTEMDRAIRQLDEKRNRRTVALCHGGGLHSAALAQELQRREIPVEIYYLDLWVAPRDKFEREIKPFADNLGFSSQKISISRIFFRTKAVENFRKYGFEYPLLLALWELFSMIPSDQFIVLGDGHLDRQDSLSKFIAESRSSLSGEGNYVVMPSNKIAHYLWAKENKREGEFYFYSSTPELIAATMQNECFESKDALSNSRGVLLSHYPELGLQQKENVWGKDWDENVFIRRWFGYLAGAELQMPFFEGSSGSLADLDQLFVK